MVAPIVLRGVLDTGDLAALRALIAAEPALAGNKFQWGTLCAIGPCLPLSYLAQARFNRFLRHGLSGELARILLRAGAPVDGEPGAAETPLITAASYDEAPVAAALIEAGANLEAAGCAVPGGTALAHAVEFGAPEIAAKLVAAGARIGSLAEAAGAGDMGGMLSAASDEDKARAFRAAAMCGRFDVLDELLNAGVDIGVLVKEGTALHWAAWEAKADAALHLIERGADCLRKDPKYNMRPLGWAQHRASQCPLSHPGGFRPTLNCLEAQEQLARVARTNADPLN